MALSEFDRNLLQLCLERKPRAWEGFVDRFLGLVVHVVNHCALARSVRLPEADREDLVAEVFLAIVSNDFAVLRRFRGQSSLATYLTVIARRVVVRILLQERATPRPRTVGTVETRDESFEPVQAAERDELERLLEGLSPHEAEVVRLFHLNGLSYRDISVATGIPENSIGPTLTRARSKMREVAHAPAES